MKSSSKTNKTRMSAMSARSGKQSRLSGASRVQKKTNRSNHFLSLQYLLKLSVVGMVAGVITAGLVLFDPKEKIARLSTQPISEVKLAGNFTFIQKHEASSLVGELIKGSFLDLNISDLKQQLEQHPWIDSVTITREWPDKLSIRIIEQQPIAQWGEKGFLNMRGDLIEVEKTANIKALPMLSGDDRFAKEIMQQYLQMNKVLAPNGFSLCSVTMDQTRGWQIEVNDGKSIKLGRTKILQKIQMLVAAERGELKEDFIRIESIDMRYPNGFAVTWMDDEKKYLADTKS